MATKQNASKAELIPYDSLFPHGVAQKAAQRVLEEIEEQRKQLDGLRVFASENADLINLVRRLPDDLHHQIMVPFGKAAFFPGRLVHTNEFLVLLGDGYYAERTAKQTVGVLTRRGQMLESKMEALRATITDLKVEAEFFGAVAGESAEGIVEIREFEEPLKGVAGVSDTGSFVSTNKHIEKETITDEEYERILAGLDDIEKAECAAESISSDNEVACAKNKISDRTDNHHKNIELQKPKVLESQRVDPVMISTGREEATSRIHLAPSSSVQAFHENKKLQPSYTDYLTEVHGTKVTNHERCSKDDFSHKCLDSSQSFPLLVALKDKFKKEKESKDKEPAREASTMSYTQRKAFTGTVVEHSDGLDSRLASPGSSQATVSKSSKPVSRFKMQRGR